MGEGYAEGHMRNYTNVFCRCLVTKSEGVGLIIRAINFQDVLQIHQRFSQTDGRTDGRTDDICIAFAQ